MPKFMNYGTQKVAARAMGEHKHTLHQFWKLFKVKTRVAHILIFLKLLPKESIKNKTTATKTNPHAKSITPSKSKSEHKKMNKTCKLPTTLRKSREWTKT